MWLDFLFRIWRSLTANIQWWLLWLINDKFMVSVSGVVVNEDGQILLQRHRHWVPDVWGFPGGIIKRGEKIEDAFARELHEETNLVPLEIELLRVVSGYRLRLEAYFYAKVANRDIQKLRIQKEEVVEARFFAMDALPENILSTQRELINVYLGKVKR